MIEELCKYPVSAMYSLPCVNVQGEYNIEEIIEAVCTAFQVPRQCLMKRECRHRMDQFARWTVWKIMRSHDRPLKECGQLFKQHHATVLYALEKLDSDIDRIDALQRNYMKVSKYMKV